VLAALPGGLVLFDVAFFVVLASLVVQGWTIRPAAQILGVALPGADHPESRTELDLPGQLEQELVGYPVRPESAYLRHPRLPSWAKLVLVVRADRILLPDEAGAVVAGDYVYVLAPPMRASGLDRLFTETERERTEEEVYFGEFVLPGTTSLREVAALYAPEANAPNQSISEAFAQALGTATVGDTLPLGTVELVAKALENDRVVEVGVRLEPEPVGERARRLARRLRLARERAA
jgi:cell volume regulation protein A